MKIIVEFYEGLFLQKKKIKLTIQGPDTSIDDLFILVAQKLQLKQKEISLKFKRDGYILKLIRGWNLSDYDIREGSLIVAEILETPEVKERKQQQQIQQKYIQKLFQKQNTMPIQLSDINEEQNDQYSSNSNSPKNKDSTQTPEYRSFNSEELETYSDQQRKAKNKKLLNYSDMCELQLQSLLQITKKGNLKEIQDLLENQIPQEYTKKEQEIYLENNTNIINENGVQGWNALHFAIFCNHIDIVQYFVNDKKADVNKVTGDGWSPLQLAISKKALVVVSTLLKSESLDINEVTHKGSALHIACKQGSTTILEQLLEYGADLYIKNEQQLSVFEIQSSIEIINVLSLYEQANTNFETYKALKIKQDLKNLQKQIEDDEKKQMNEFQKICRDLNIFCPPKPPQALGHIYKVGTILFGKKLRYLVLDIDQGCLLRFKNKNRFPRKPTQIIPLSEITHLKYIKPGGFMDKQLFYFELNHVENQIYACKNHHTTKLWIHYIYQAICYNKIQRKIERKGHQLKLIDQGKSQKIELKDDSLKDRELWDREQQIIYQKTQQNRQTQTILKQSIIHYNQSQIKSQKTQPELVSLPSQPQLPNIPEQEKPQNTQQENNTQNSQQSNTNNEQKQQNQQEIDDEALQKISSEKVNFDSFTIIKLLGQGAFGKVFLVQKKDNDQMFAMKALKKRNLILKKQLRFAVTEANVLKSCNHTFVMGLHYAFQTPSYLYLVMDYCPGGDLGQHLLQRTTFDEDASRFYIAELVLAVESLHKKNIIYRDLKPENILIAQDGHVKLADFGLSKEGIGRNDQTATFCGTPAYLSPEMVGQKKASPMSDIYGIGTCLYEMLTGEPPFYTDDIPTMYKLIKDSSLKYPGFIHKQTKEFLKKILEKNPQKRLGFNGFHEIKNDPYFAKIDFKALEQKKYKPPILDFEEEEELDLQLFNTRKPAFKDQDYTEDNKRINRVIKFTFARNNPQQQQEQQ